MKRLPWELVFWILALLLLATATPEAQGHEHHFTFCPLANLGYSWCPGCGIGRGITLLFHGDIRESFTQHWFAVPALFIIGYRIALLARVEIFKKLY